MKYARLVRNLTTTDKAERGREGGLNMCLKLKKNLQCTQARYLWNCFQLLLLSSISSLIDYDTPCSLLAMSLPTHWACSVAWWLKSYLKRIYDTWAGASCHPPAFSSSPSFPGNSLLPSLFSLSFPSNFPFLPSAFKCIPSIIYEHSKRALQMWQLLQQNDANNDTEMCKENTSKKRDYSRRNYSGSTTSCYPAKEGNLYSRIVRGSLPQKKKVLYCVVLLYT